MSHSKEVHVARQPIFDESLNVFGYELLFRGQMSQEYDGVDADQATTDVIVNSFLFIGIEKLTSGRRAFINFTANSFEKNLPAMLPKDSLVVEILEDIVPDAKLIAACKELKKAGYIIALDDFVYRDEYLPLFEFIDIIKVDFRLSSPQQRQDIVRKLGSYPIQFLAEKVETYDEYQEALDMGYTYFQGYFFCKPVIMSCKSFYGHKANYFQILQAVNNEEFEFGQVEEIFKRDVSLSYKLLKFINSPVFGFQNQITSLRQALTLLGKNELKKWVSLLMLRDLAKEKPKEVLVLSLSRARFAESLAMAKNKLCQPSHAFLLGMFSLLDVLLDRPLPKILAEMALDPSLKNALSGAGEEPLTLLYKLILAYEKGEWDAYAAYAEKMTIDDQLVRVSYQDSLEWSRSLLVQEE